MVSLTTILCVELFYWTLLVFFLITAVHVGCLRYRPRGSSAQANATTEVPWITTLDLRVVRTQGHLELVDLNLMTPVNITVHSFDSGGGGAPRTADWDIVQPSDESSTTTSLPSSLLLPHIQTQDGFLRLRGDDVIRLTSEKSWILTFEARRLHNDDTGFHIVLGPAGMCNCQVRFEGKQALGIYFTNKEFGVYESKVLPHDTFAYHAITLMYHRPTHKCRLFQDNELVAQWTVEHFYAEFSYLGSWFSGRYPAQIALRRVLFLEKDDTSAWTEADK